MVNDTVHPYAIYLLWGGDYALADSSGSVVAVDIGAVAKSNAVSGLKLFKRDGWYGFVDGKETFKYKIIGMNKQSGGKVLCVLDSGVSDSFANILLIRRYRKRTWKYGHEKFLDVICCDGIESVVRGISSP